MPFSDAQKAALENKVRKVISKDLYPITIDGYISYIKAESNKYFPFDITNFIHLLTKAIQDENFCYPLDFEKFALLLMRISSLQLKEKRFSDEFIIAAIYKVSLIWYRTIENYFTPLMNLADEEFVEVLTTFTSRAFKDATQEELFKKIEELSTKPPEGGYFCSIHVDDISAHDRHIRERTAQYKNQVVFMPDLHGSVDRLLFTLREIGILELSDEDTLDLSAIYQESAELTPENYARFKAILARGVWHHDVHLLVGGDVFADRGLSDLLTIEVFSHLQNFSVLYSNHDKWMLQVMTSDTPLRAMYEELADDDSDWKKQTRSLENLIKFIEKDPNKDELEKEIKAKFNHVYNSRMKLLDVHVSETEPRQITFYSHATLTRDILENLFIKVFGAGLDEILHDKDVEGFLDCIRQLNAHFALHKEEMATESDNASDGFTLCAWNRCLPESRQALNIGRQSYSLNFCFGHTARDFLRNKGQKLKYYPAETSVGQPGFSSGEIILYTHPVTLNMNYACIKLFTFLSTLDYKNLNDFFVINTKLRMWNAFVHKLCELKSRYVETEKLTVSEYWNTLKQEERFSISNLPEIAHIFSMTEKMVDDLILAYENTLPAIVALLHEEEAMPSATAEAMPSGAEASGSGVAPPTSQAKMSLEEFFLNEVSEAKNKSIGKILVAALEKLVQSNCTQLTEESLIFLAQLSPENQESFVLISYENAYKDKATSSSMPPPNWKTPAKACIKPFLKTIGSHLQNVEKDLKAEQKIAHAQMEQDQYTQAENAFRSFCGSAIKTTPSALLMRMALASVKNWSMLNPEKATQLREFIVTTVQDHLQTQGTLTFEPSHALLGCGWEIVVTAIRLVWQKNKEAVLARLEGFMEDVRENPNLNFDYFNKDIFERLLLMEPEKGLGILSFLIGNYVTKAVYGHSTQAFKGTTPNLILSALQAFTGQQTIFNGKAGTLVSSQPSYVEKITGAQPPIHPDYIFDLHLAQDGNQVGEFSLLVQPSSTSSSSPNLSEAASLIQQRQRSELARALPEYFSNSTGNLSYIETVIRNFASSKRYVNTETQRPLIDISSQDDLGNTYGSFSFTSSMMFSAAGAYVDPSSLMRPPSADEYVDPSIPACVVPMPVAAPPSLSHLQATSEGLDSYPLTSETPKNLNASKPEACAKILFNLKWFLYTLFSEKSPEQSRLIHAEDERFQCWFKNIAKNAREAIPESFATLNFESTLILDLQQHPEKFFFNRMHAILEPFIRQCYNLLPQERHLRKIPLQALIQLAFYEMMKQCKEDHLFYVYIKKYYDLHSCLDENLSGDQIREKNNFYDEVLEVILRNIAPVSTQASGSSSSPPEQTSIQLPTAPATSTISTVFRSPDPQPEKEKIDPTPFKILLIKPPVVTRRRYGTTSQSSDGPPPPANGPS